MTVAASAGGSKLGNNEARMAGDEGTEGGKAKYERE